MTVEIRQTNPEALKKLLQRYKNAGNGEVALGWPKGTEAASLAYPDGTPVLLVAFWNNFGTDKIPRRDFMTPGGEKAIEKTAPIAAAEMKKFNEGKVKLEDILEKMGAVGAFEIGQAAVDLKDPPNAPGTIEGKKGAENPLVETGLLTQSVTHKVR